MFWLSRTLWSGLFKSERLIYRRMFCKNSFDRRFAGIRRCMLYVPGNKFDKIEKASTLNVDSVILNCEDGVSAAQKGLARDNILKALNEVRFNSELCVRLNSAQSGLLDDDINVILNANRLPDTFLLPKVEDVGNIESFVGDLGSKLQSKQSDLSGEKPLEIMIYTESALGLLNLEKICVSIKQTLEGSFLRLSGVVFGSDDYCADIGAVRTTEGKELDYARQKIVVVSKAMNLQAIDMVFIDFQDTEGLRAAAEEGCALGFTGKQAIHPNQISTIQKAFLPSQEKVEWALGIVDAYERPGPNGKTETEGVVTFKGQMIDQPLYKQAQNILHILRHLDEQERFPK